MGTLGRIDVYLPTYLPCYVNQNYGKPCERKWRRFCVLGVFTPVGARLFPAFVAGSRERQSCSDISPPDITLEGHAGTFGMLSRTST
jgi:hypothetical protein